MSFLRKAAEVLRILKKIDTAALTPALRQGAKLAGEVGKTLAKAKKEFKTLREANSKFNDAASNLQAVPGSRHVTSQTRIELVNTGNALKEAAGQLVQTSKAALDQAQALLDQANEMEKALAGTSEAAKASELAKQARAAHSHAYEANRVAQQLNRDMIRGVSDFQNAASTSMNSVESVRRFNANLPADPIQNPFTVFEQNLQTATDKSKELSDSLSELSRSTGISLGAGIVGVGYSSQLPEHPLDPVKDAVIDGTIQGLEVVDSVVCLGGYNPICAVEDAAVSEVAIPLGSAAGDATVKGINKVFNQIEAKANDPALLHPATWGIGGP